VAGVVKYVQEAARTGSKAVELWREGLACVCKSLSTGRAKAMRNNGVELRIGRRYILYAGFWS